MIDSKQKQLIKQDLEINFGLFYMRENEKLVSNGKAREGMLERGDRNTEGA